ncbi:MAG: MMPL family transporter [Trueperaceae bacterium]|nr:MMPL family transporter [Trueperaceae bacterium]
MIAVFSLFVFSDVVLIQTLGLGLAVAVLLDATLVRLTLVPAVLALAGTWNWWLPGPIARLAERVDLSHDSCRPRSASTLR